jgi:hypothetical protein
MAKTKATARGKGTGARKTSAAKSSSRKTGTARQNTPGRSAAGRAKGGGAKGRSAKGGSAKGRGAKAAKKSPTRKPTASAARAAGRKSAAPAAGRKSAPAAGRKKGAGSVASAARKRASARKASGTATSRPAAKATRPAAKPPRASAKSRPAAKPPHQALKSAPAAAKPTRRAAKSFAASTKRPPFGGANRLAGKNASAADPGSRRPPTLDRNRRTVREDDIKESDMIPSPPSSLDLDRSPSAARSGGADLAHRLHQHTSTGPELTGGDVDADWQSAELVGDEAPGGDSPTPDQDIVDEIGRAVGIEYADDEELKGGDELVERDRKRWELDPASSEDFEDRD